MPAQIDVVIPVYNAETTVEAAIASIQVQTIRDTRIIVVDDGSTDGSPAILARLAADDGRVQIVRQPNGGIVDALNNGLTLCTAPFIARHDADDLAFSDRFARQLDYLNVYPRCVAVDGYYWIIDSAGRRTGAQAFAYGPVRSDAFSFPSEEPYLSHPFLIVRREPLVAVGGYRHVFHSEDTDLYWRLLELGELRHMPLFVGEYRYHPGSVSSRSIVNGRVAAISSQLAAVSYRRRAAGQPDIGFPRVNLRRYAEAEGLEAMLSIAGEQLDEAERHWLRVAACAKLLELGSYRPYLLDEGDAAFVAGTLDCPGDPLSAGLGKLVTRNRGSVTIKLALAGRWRAARRLGTSPASNVASAVRYAGLKGRELYGRRRGLWNASA